MYLVVGTGRSGTSSVARILHENFNVMMGEVFAIGPNSHEVNCYESQLLYSMNFGFVDGKLSMPQYSRIFEDTFNSYYKHYGENWGYKDPTMAYTLPLMLAFCRNMPFIIWVHRDHELVIKSFMKCYNLSEGVASAEVERRIRRLRIWCTFLPHHKIDIGSGIVPEEELIERVGKLVELHNNHHKIVEDYSI